MTILSSIKKFRSSIEDVRVLRTAAGAVGTDHDLLQTKIRFHLKYRKKRSTQRHARLDRKKLQDEKRVKQFQDELEQRVTNPNTNIRTADSKYSEFVECVKKVSTDVFQQDTIGRKRKEWLTDEILDVVDKKVVAFLEWQNHKGTTLEQRYHQKYRMLRTLAKKKIDAGQLEYWDERSADIERAIKQNDTATVYRIIRCLRGSRANVENQPIQEAGGCLILDAQERLDRWKEYFSKLLNVPSSIDPSVVHQIPAATITSAEELRQDMPPTLNEVEQEINKTKSGKAPGIDDISADILKAGGRPIVKWLHEIFVDVWLTEETVGDWTTAILIQLYKNKGDKTICDNYRGISLLTVTSKVFSRVILNRVQGTLDKQLLEEQAGSRTNRSTIDQIFTLKMVMEKTHALNKPLFMCFIDIQKAYDSVHRPLLWQICRHYGLSDKIIRMLHLLYTNTRAKVRINGELSDTFDIETGVVQDGRPSPILFNIFFDFVIRRVIEKAVASGVNGIELAYGKGDFFHPASEPYDLFNIIALIYADDLVVMCNNSHDLEIFIRTFEDVTQDLGLTMSIRKTCTMALQQLKQDGTRRIIKGKEVSNKGLDITIRNQKIEVVEDFLYLGCYITRDQSIAKEIETRLSKASKTFNMLRNIIWYRKTVSTQAKLRIFRTCVLPVLLCGSEVWSTTVAQEARLNVFYLKCLRTLVGANLGDRIPNTKLLKITGTPELAEILRRNRLGWFGHVNRMNNSDGTHQS